MPLVTFDLLKGKSDQHLKSMLDATHEAVLEAFGVPERDRYQIIYEHEPTRMVVEDTGLNISRSESQVVVRVFSRPRTQNQKRALYELLSAKLERACGIAATDVVGSLVISQDEDWSFGLGKAQFLTGEL